MLFFLGGRVRSADGSRCLEFLRPHSAPAHDDVVNRVCVHSFAFEIEVVVGATHLQSNFVAHETSMCMSTASLESTVREGFDASCLVSG